jgi:hypothetical protein
MAEPKDYLSGLLQDSTIDTGKKTSAEYLETVKQKLIALGAKPGTGEYENAFVSYLNIRGGNQGTFGNKDFKFSDTPKKALDYLKTGLTPAQVKELGVDPAGFGGFGKQETFVPGRTLQNPKTFETVNIADLDVLPDWFNPQSLPGFAEAGIKAGAKVTPELQAKISQLMGAGAATTGTATGTEDGAGTENGTGTPTGVATGYDPVTKTFTASDGRKFTDQQAYVTYQGTLAGQKAERQSAYDLLYSQFKQYGLESLVEPLKGLITTGASPSEFTIKLRESEPYKKRFTANAKRVAQGLRSLSESEYIQLEDQYQDVMRRYGLPDTYYARGDMGTQEGFNKFLEGDVSPVELEERIATAQKRVLNANPEVIASLKQFYPDINNADILAYSLDPKNAIENIKRKVTAAEIGGAAIQAGLGLTGTRAEELGAAGITKAQAQQGFQTVAEVAPRGSQLADIYKQNPYTQQTAEAEVFGLAGSVDAARQRKKLTSLETAAFSGSAGAGAIARDRAGGF